MRLMNNRCSSRRAEAQTPPRRTDSKPSQTNLQLKGKKPPKYLPNILKDVMHPEERGCL